MNSQALPTAATDAHKPTERLYKTAEFAEAVNISLSHAIRIVSRREVRTVRIGTNIRIPESAITEFIAARVTPAMTHVTTRATSPVTVTQPKRQSRNSA